MAQAGKGRSARLGADAERQRENSEGSDRTAPSR